ncbi:MAG TPA: VCBS repeat-containing protein [Symbiobacteriaceae bacterium]|nr:VCBS repeat-containing protein [Symbiobacteriaceae bacterium]
MPWVHMEPIPGHPISADIDVTSLPDPVRFGLAADVDGDGRAELILAPDRGQAGASDLWVMKYRLDSGKWEHLSPIAEHALLADVGVAATPMPILTVFAGNFDGRDSMELAVVPKGQPGVWVMRYDAVRRAWAHLSPQANSPIGADLVLPWPVKFAAAGDFDGDGKWELAVIPQADGLIRVYRYKGGGHWDAVAEVGVDSGPSKQLVTGRFDGGPHWLAVIPERPTPEGTTLVAMRLIDGAFVPMHLSAPAGQTARLVTVGNFAGGAHEQLALNGQGDQFVVFQCTREPAGFFYWRPLGEPFDCCDGRYGARFAVAGDFDGDGRAELAVAPDAPGSYANDFWVMRWDGAQFVHLGQQPGNGAQADVDASPLAYRARFAVAGNFSGARDSLAVAIHEQSTRGNDLWVMHFADEPGPKVTFTGQLTMTPLSPLVGPRQPVRRQVKLHLQFNPFHHRFSAVSTADLPLRSLETLTGPWDATLHVSEKLAGTADTGTGAMTMELPFALEVRRPGLRPAHSRSQCHLTTGLIRHPHRLEGSPVNPQTGAVTLVGVGRMEGGPLDGTDYALMLAGTLVPNPLP